MNKFITEISEKDFRRMNLTAYEHVKVVCDDKSYRMGWKEVHLNDILDENLKHWNEYFINEPRIIVVAIHTNQELALEYERLWEEKVKNGDIYVMKELPDNFFYLDKFMNRFSGAQTYQIGCGIRHIYSTRDYYEAHEDYWRVKKNETEAIYKIYLED